MVRHPMYTGGILYTLGMPLLLRSWLGLLVLPLVLGALSVRIFIEESALRKELAPLGLADVKMSALTAVAKVQLKQDLTDITDPEVLTDYTASLRVEVVGKFRTSL